MNDSYLHTGCTMAELTLRSLRRYPDRVAMAMGDQSLAYRGMEEGISRAVQGLKSLGLNRGDGMAQLAGNQLDAALVRTAASVMGLRYTALHPLGSEEDHTFILHDGEIAALVVDNGPFAERGSVLAQAVPGLKAVLTLGPAGFGQDLSAVMARHEPQPDLPPVIVPLRELVLGGASPLPGSSKAPQSPEQGTCIQGSYGA